VKAARAHGRKIGIAKAKAKISQLEGMAERIRNLSALQGSRHYLTAHNIHSAIDFLVVGRFG
jgi:hypothetical protein